MSLANIQGKLSRAEMKQIMAGSGSICRSGTCSVYNTTDGVTYSGTCNTYVHADHSGNGTSSSHCICWTSLQHYNSSNNYAACTA